MVILRGHVATIAPVIVQVMRVPFPENIIGPPIDRMAMVIGPDVNSQFIQQLQVELHFGKQLGVGVLEDDR